MVNKIQSILTLKESIEPHELKNENNIDDILLEKIKNKLGNKCHKEGFIEKDSINILKRSMGNIISSHFNGNIIYTIQINAKICNPVQGEEIICTVKGKNKMGILAEVSPLIIALTKIHHKDESVFDTLDENDKIKVKVICSQFQFNDTNINVLAHLLEKL